MTTDAGRADENRAIRQEALREQLSAQKHVEQVIDNIEKIESLSVDTKGGDEDEIDYKSLQLNQFKLQQLKTANEQRLKLVNKYLPDLKSMDLVADVDHSGELHITWQTP